jgi:phenylacetate-CoA ligase
MSLYVQLYQRLLWPTYDRLRGRQTHRLYKQAQQNQWKSPEELHQLQWRELQALLRHADQHSPWHRSRWQTLGISAAGIRSPDDFAKLPPVTRQDIQAHRDEMLAENYRGRVYAHRTGGSTGSPLAFYVNRASYEWRLAVSLRGYSWAGCRDGERQFYVWGEPIGTPRLKQRLKTSLHNAVLRRKLFSCFRFSEPAMAECVRQINRYRPKTIVGYTTALCLLAQYLRDHHLEIARPNAVVTAAEGVNSLQRQLMEAAFGAPVFVPYGSREFMLIAMECEQHNGLHISADNLIVEVLAPEGEVGEIVITDLHNYGMPFIRYKIGDLGVATSRQCPCGRGLPLLERVEGRVLDAIRTPDGRVLPGEFFPHMLKEFDAVRQFQVIQKRLDLLEVKLVLRDSNHADQLTRIRQEITQRLGNAITVNIERVTEIPQTASGKFRVTVSELNSSAGVSPVSS